MPQILKFLPLLIALVGVGVAWGTSKAALSSTNAQVTDLHKDTRDLQDKVQAGQISQATINQALEDIQKRLDSIQRQLEKLDNKIDRIRK